MEKKLLEDLPDDIKSGLPYDTLMKKYRILSRKDFQEIITKLLEHKLIDRADIEYLKYFDETKPPSIISRMAAAVKRTITSAKRTVSEKTGIGELAKRMGQIPPRLIVVGIGCIVMIWLLGNWLADKSIDGPPCECVQDYMNRTVAFLEAHSLKYEKSEWQKIEVEFRAKIKMFGQKDPSIKDRVRELESAAVLWASWKELIWTIKGSRSGIDKETRQTLQERLNKVQAICPSVQAP